MGTEQGRRQQQQQQQQQWSAEAVITHSSPPMPLIQCISLQFG
jgi:hypothetical protein